MSKRALRDEDNNIVGILGVYIDITERKKQEDLLKQSLEQVKQASQSKSAFIANMSHDLRTPLTGIMGMIQDMMSTADQASLSLHERQPTEAPDLLKNMIHTVQRDSQLLMGSADELLQLCNEILEVARLESGKLDEHIDSFSLHALIAHNLDLLQPAARHKKLELSYDIAQEVPAYLSNRRIYLDRVLLNLISNALKFTEAGVVKVSALVLDKSAKDYQVGDRVTIQILVEDTGIGIPQGQFNTIFEHFSRLTPAYEGIYKGAGLGLYTVKRYVEAMQGSIAVESKMGEGTCFKVTLPCTVSDHADQVSICSTKTLQSGDVNALLEQPKSGSTQVAKASILLVEDNAIAAYAVAQALGILNCEVDTAENGAKAVEMAEVGAYDLIFMDVGLPDFSGIEATKKIRALTDPQKSQVPIIELSGHADNSEMRQEALDAGMQEVMSKPAQAPVLKAILKKYV